MEKLWKSRENATFVFMGKIKQLILEQDKPFPQYQTQLINSKNQNIVLKN
jgi:hypothetical protein